MHKFLVFLIFVVACIIAYPSQVKNALAQNNQEISQDINLKIKELESKQNYLEKLIDVNNENAQKLIDSSNSTIGFATSINWVVAIIIGVMTLLTGYYFVQIQKKLNEIDEVKLELQKTIKFNDLLVEARHYMSNDQRFEAEKRAKIMRELRPNAPNGYFYQGLYLKSIRDYDGACEAMLKAHNILGGNSVITTFNLACYCSLKNKLDLAFNYLNTVLDINPRYLKNNLTDEDLKNLKSDPRYQEIVNKMVQLGI